MYEFEIIKQRMKEAILLDPVIQEHYISSYLEKLEKCNSLEELPEELKRYVKIVLVEMKEEQEDIEEYNNELEIEKQEMGITTNGSILDDAISKLDNAINNSDELDNIEIKNNGDELFDYIKDGKVVIDKKNKRVSSNEHIREIRYITATILRDLYSQRYVDNYVLSENLEDYEKLKQDIQKFVDIASKYGFNYKISDEDYKKYKEMAENNILSFQQYEIIQMLCYGILNDYKTIDEYSNNGILDRLMTRLYIYLYKLDENDDFNKSKVKEYILNKPLTLTNIMDDYLNEELNANEFAFIINLDSVDVSDKKEFDMCLFKIIDKYKTVVEVGERTISSELTYLNNRKTLLIAFAKGIDNHKHFGHFCKNNTNDLVIEF